jgi:hypothetical protein
LKLRADFGINDDINHLARFIAFIKLLSYFSHRHRDPNPFFVLVVRWKKENYIEVNDFFLFRPLDQWMMSDVDENFPSEPFSSLKSKPRIWLDHDSTFRIQL